MRNKSLLLSLLLLMLTMETEALAYDFKSGELYYTIVSQRDKTVEVAYGKTTYANRVVVPARVKYQDKLWNVVGLGTDAFYGSNKLTELVLPEGMKYIAGGALDYCTGLTRLTLPEGITLKSYALRHAGLVFLRVPGTARQLADYHGQMSNLPWLTAVELAEGVETIPVGAFQFDSRLERVKLPSTLRRIGKHAFVGCDSLKVLDIPASVETMGPVVDFGECALQEIHVHWTMPIRVAAGTFPKETYLNAVLYVPKNTKVWYRQTVGWRNFRNIVEE